MITLKIFNECINNELIIPIDYPVVGMMGLTAFPSPVMPVMAGSSGSKIPRIYQFLLFQSFYIDLKTYQDF